MVLISFLLTAFATGILVTHMPTVSAQTDAVRRAEASDLQGLGGDLLHPSIGLGLLVVILVLNVYKPRGMTRYGQRRTQERTATALPR